MDLVTAYQSDHDLLVTLNERVKNLVDHISGVVDSNRTLVDDHEKRIRATEKIVESMQSSSSTWRYILSSAVSLLGLAIGALAFYHK